MYIFFYGDQQTPLYIGKSKNIHDRVCSHFSHEYKRSLEQELYQSIRHIEVIETAGNLGAMIFESLLIKKKTTVVKQKTPS